MEHIWQFTYRIWKEFLYPWRQIWGYFRGYWYIKFITILIVLILIIAVLVQIFKSTHCCFAIWLFAFLSEWALVLSASVTLMLALAAFWAIMDNRYARIVDRKEHLLNEIIQ